MSDKKKLPTAQEVAEIFWKHNGGFQRNLKECTQNLSGTENSSRAMLTEDQEEKDPK